MYSELLALSISYKVLLIFKNIKWLYLSILYIHFYRDASRDTLLEHVKGHYEQQHHQLSPGGIGGLLTTITNGFPSTSNGLVISPIPEAQDFTLRGTSPDDRDEASVNNITSSAKGGANNQAPFRCGHCNQVSNWKHVIQVY